MTGTVWTGGSLSIATHGADLGTEVAVGAAELCHSRSQISGSQQSQDWGAGQSGIAKGRGREGGDPQPGTFQDGC